MLAAYCGAACEHSRAGDEYIGAGVDGIVRGLRIDAAIDLELDRLADASIAREPPRSWRAASMNSARRSRD